MPKISIITTSYNHKDFIGYTIQSILDQSINDWELLIGDDSPGNETWEVIQTYTKKYPDKIKARHHTPNKWIVDNMNFLINKISPESEYVAFLEGDDLRDKKYLEKKLAIFTKYQQIKIVYNNLDFIDRNNQTIQKNIFKFRKIKTYHNEKISPNEFISAKVWPIISRSTAMIEKSMMTKYKITSLNPENKAYSVSDYDFYFQIAKDYPVWYINEPLTLYRRHHTNLSGTNPKVMDEVSDLIKHYHQQKSISDTTYNKKMSHNKLMQSIIYLENKDKKNSFRKRKESLSYNICSNCITKIALLGLLCLPSKLSKRILSKIIKRG